MQGPTNVFAITIPEMCSRTQILYQDAVPSQEHLDGILAGSLERLPLEMGARDHCYFSKDSSIL